jgi:hypothetical protein
MTFEIKQGNDLGPSAVVEAFLRDHGCDEMQGYLFSRPVSAGSIPALLRFPTVASPNLQPLDFQRHDFIGQRQI